jgi:hypothetical protein
VGIPDDATGRIHCPKCNEVVFQEDPQTKVKWRAPPPSGEWMKVAGYVSVGLGALAFIASVYVNWEPRKTTNPDGAILAGLLNPLFFIGVPLGIYWLRRSGEFERHFGVRPEANNSKSDSGKDSSRRKLGDRDDGYNLDRAPLPPVLQRLAGPPSAQPPSVSKHHHAATPADKPQNDSSHAMPDVPEIEIEGVWDEVLFLPPDESNRDIDEVHRRNREQWNDI